MPFVYILYSPYVRHDFLRYWSKVRNFTHRNKYLLLFLLYVMRKLDHGTFCVWRVRHGFFKQLSRRNDVGRIGIEDSWYCQVDSHGGRVHVVYNKKKYSIQYKKCKYFYVTKSTQLVLYSSCF